MKQEVLDMLERFAATSYRPPKLGPQDDQRASDDIVGFILKKVCRKKFRRRVSEATRLDIQGKIGSRVSQGRPIHLTIPFGGYKHYWNDSSPGIDWAEFFHLWSMCDYAAPITRAYEPGIIFEYISQDMIVPRMNNYSTEAMDVYARQFKELVAWFNPLVRPGIEIRYWRVGDRCDQQGILGQVESEIPTRMESFRKLSVERAQVEIHRSARAVNWNGQQDLTLLGDSEKRERIIESRQVELAYYETEALPDNLGSYFFEDDRIDVWFSGGLSADNPNGGLTLATARGSVVDAGIGTGVIDWNHGRPFGTIVSQQQWRQFVEAGNRRIDVSAVSCNLHPGAPRTVNVINA